MEKRSLILILLVGLVVLGGLGFFAFNFFQNKSSQQVFCTQEAKQCSDGTYVSRTGPKCEFAQCPPANDQSTNNQPTNWKSLNNPQLGFNMSYPENFFDAGHEPKIFSVNCTYKSLPANCPNMTTFVPSKPGGVATTERVSVNGNDYCKYSLQDAATGHVYYYDYYATVKNQRCIVVELDTSSQNCDFYLPLEQGNDQQKQNYESCLAKNKERPNILQQIIATFQFPK